MNVFDIAVVVDLLFNWGAGWRYVFSRTFRRKVHEQWKRRRGASLFFDVTAYFIVFVFVNGIVIGFLALVCLWLYRDIIARHFGA